MGSLQTQIVQAHSAAVELASMLRWARPYEEGIYRVALTLVGNQEDADRVLAETVRTAWDRHVRSHNSHPSLLDVMGIAVAASLSILRGHAGDLAGWLEESDTHLGDLPMTLTAWEAEPANLFTPAEWKRIQKLALESLTPLDRAVFLLRDVLHFSFAETAELTGKPAGAVRVRLLRARLRLREWLNPLCRATSAPKELVAR